MTRDMKRMKSLQSGDPVAKAVPFRARLEVGNREMGRRVLDGLTALTSATSTFHKVH
jgi:hypothetical protein